MKLKEKFRVKILSFLSDNMKDQNANECVKIAEEFAIEFADWFFNHWYEDQVGYYEASDLLETFKKERGL